jgi:glucosamine--fructose-6-phosphate aminotransferase (isomerizing)
MQLVDVRTPVFIIQGLEEEEQVHTLGERFLRFGASTVVIKRKSEDTVSRSTATIEVAPDIEEVFSPLVYVIPLQLYAYYSSLERGLNPDKPGKLTKVVK